jgi:hypothetical protein
MNTSKVLVDGEAAGSVVAPALLQQLQGRPGDRATGPTAAPQAPKWGVRF